MVFQHKSHSETEAVESDESEPPHSHGLDPKPVKRFSRGLFILKEDAGVYATRQGAIQAAIPYFNGTNGNGNHKTITQVSRRADKWYVYLKYM